MDDNEGHLLKSAESLSIKGLNSDALELCNRVISRSQENYEAYELRSSIFRKLGDLNNAVEDIGRVIQLMPKNASPYFRRGRYLLKLGENKAAILDFTKAIELDNGYFGEALRFYRAEALLRCNDFEGAIRDCEAMANNYSVSYFDGYGQRSRDDIELAARERILRVHR